MRLAAPNFVDINITDRCNMACRHCYIGDQSSKDLPLETGLDYIRQIAELGVFKVALTGGEPLLHPNWLDFLKQIVKLGLSPMMNTNGFLFNNEVCEKIDRIKFNDPMWVSISLDGLVPGRYSELRRWKNGKPADDAFSVVINNAINMARRGYRVVFNFTFTQVNYEDLLPLYQYLENKFVSLPFILNVILFGLSGNGAKNMGELSVPYELWENAIHEIMESKLEGKLRFLKVEPTCPWEIYLPLRNYGNETIERSLGYVSPLRNPFFASQRTIGCHAGLTNLVINWDGDVHPCGLYPRNDLMYAGSLKEQSLNDIWNSSEKLNLLRGMDLRDMPTECQNCEFSSICGGGCRGAASQITGNIRGKDIRCPLLDEGKKNV